MTFITTLFMKLVNRCKACHKWALKNTSPSSSHQVCYYFSSQSLNEVDVIRHKCNYISTTWSHLAVINHKDVSKPKVNPCKGDAPINIIPNYPLLGYVGGNMRHLTSICYQNLPNSYAPGVFDLSPYECSEVWTLTSKYPHKSPCFRWGDSTDLTDWHAQ